jgi:hypothetical protein
VSTPDNTLLSSLQRGERSSEVAAVFVLIQIDSARRLMDVRARAVAIYEQHRGWYGRVPSEDASHVCPSALAR